MLISTSSSSKSINSSSNSALPVVPSSAAATTADQMLLRQHLKATLARLSNDLVELINSDYMHFINLSVELEPRVPSTLSKLKALLVVSDNSNSVDSQKVLLSQARSLLQTSSEQLEMFSQLMDRRRLIQKWKYILTDWQTLAEYLHQLKLCDPDKITVGPSAILELKRIVGLLTDCRVLVDLHTDIQPPFIETCRQQLKPLIGRWITFLTHRLRFVTDDEKVVPVEDWDVDIVRLVMDLDYTSLPTAFFGSFIATNGLTIDSELSVDTIRKVIQSILVPFLSEKCLHSQRELFNMIIRIFLMANQKTVSVASNSFHSEYLATAELIRWIRSHCQFMSEPMDEFLSKYMQTRFNINLFFSIQFKQAITISNTLPARPISSRNSSQYNVNSLSNQQQFDDVFESLAGVFSRFRQTIDHIASIFIPSIAFKYYKLFFQCCIQLDKQVAAIVNSIRVTPGSFDPNQVVDVVRQLMTTVQTARDTLDKLCMDVEQVQVKQMLDFGLRQSMERIPTTIEQLRQIYHGHFSRTCIEQARQIKNIPILYRRKADTDITRNLFEKLPQFPQSTVEIAKKLLDINLQIWNLVIINETGQELLQSTRDLITQLDSLKRLKQRQSTEDDQDNREIVSLVCGNIESFASRLNQPSQEYQELSQTRSQMQDLANSLRLSTTKL